jgi:GT2 family glycosyltransferase
MSAGPQVSVVIPNWNGRRWLGPCLEALSAQQLAPAEVIVVDNGSVDCSVEYLGAAHPDVRVIALSTNTGFAHAANRGLRDAACELVALVNTDVLVAPDWLARVAPALAADPAVAAVACKMLSLEDPARVYDAGDILRRDGVCEQRGRFLPDDGRWDRPGEVFGACAGAALYRRSDVLAVGGFDERYIAYLEDVDLALKLRLSGRVCRYEPAVARHAGEGSSRLLPGGHQFLVTRNTVLLVARWFPVRWLPYVAYRQLAWGWHALLERRLGMHLRALGAALPMLRAAVAGRRRRRVAYPVRIEDAVPPRPFRGRRAGGHPAGAYASPRVNNDV